MIVLDILEPKNCKDCIFRDYEFNMCFASTKDETADTADYVDEFVNGEFLKPDWCPASKRIEQDINN